MKQIWIKLIALACLVMVSTGLAGPGNKAILKKADKAFEQEHFRLAGNLYNSYLKSAPNDAYANYKAGLCYLELNEPGNAKLYLNKAYKENASISSQILLMLARAYHLNADFEQAVIIYKQELSASSRRDGLYIEFLQKCIDECKAGMAMLEQSQIASIHNLGPAVNTSFSDYVPVLLSGDSVMLYSVRQPSTAKNKGMEQIYRSVLKNKEWQAALPFLNETNGLANHAVVSVAQQDRVMYTYLTGKGLYCTRQTETGWAKPERLSSPFNQGSTELSIFVTEDGRFAFFSSDRSGGFGGLDLYISYKKPDGTWSEALNMGPTVNTVYDEDAPFVDTTTNTLYFSSTGHNSIGGYDIFKSHIKGSSWSKAQSLGIPINSPYDDIYFILSPLKNSAYFSSDRPGGHGAKDIYQVVW
ncbi:hypothetical protein [Pontibacter vulgaris]|uniref:hypothetical protein n=1 Tax=Pontibacter vulgaris TaxID=2905679 RepID=UPI001FA728F9|nr:hypothetical protein [Pontibacter vulgaris]